MPTDQEAIFEACDNRGRYHAVRIREAAQGLMLQIGRGYWEYYLRDLVCHPIPLGSSLCVDGGGDIYITPYDTARIYQAARVYSGLARETCERIQELWDQARTVRAELGGNSYEFNALLDEIYELWDAGA